MGYIKHHFHDEICRMYEPNIEPSSGCYAPRIEDDPGYIEWLEEKEQENFAAMIKDEKYAEEMQESMNAIAMVQAEKNGEEPF